jgi:hypothetical protein
VILAIGREMLSLWLWLWLRGVVRERGAGRLKQSNVIVWKKIQNLTGDRDLNNPKMPEESSVIG